MNNNLWFVLFSACFISSNSANAAGKIDREQLVKRHNVTLKTLDDLGALSVGNGRFCYTADITGMQTFPEYYANGIPLTTMSEWGWHSFPNTDRCKLSDTFIELDAQNRKVPCPINMNNKSTKYLRTNPHQTSLAQVGLKLLKSYGNEVKVQGIQFKDQSLDLWHGIMTSHFLLEAEPVEVTTICHPQKDQLSFKVRTALLNKGQIALKIRFPYGSPDKDPSDFKSNDKHTSDVISQNSMEIVFKHVMDSKVYYCKASTSENVKCSKQADHSFEISPSGKVGEICLNIEFREVLAELNPDPFELTMNKNNKSWEQFWGSGGAVDLSESTDPRWKELERRIVLSQYLTAIQSRQQYPPQETGLTCDSLWHGKFHLEMHWWHSVHFALWGRLEYLENTLGYYFNIMPQAKAYTRMQGYEGVRWPKMTDPSGIDSPSWIGPLLVWQQPHPIYYAELVYRQKPTKETLEKYSVIVLNTAEFMASYPAYNEQRKCYELGPPIISYREFNDTGYAFNKNPTFELAYWTWGLRKANEWRERMGLERIKKWDDIADRMAPWPINKGIYVEQETPLVKESSSPAMLAAYGWLPESKQLNREIMLKTLKYVVSENWGYADMWGSEYNMVVWTAARLGEPEMAVDALLRDEPTNGYLPNGHNFQNRNLPVFLPGNAGLLTSVAMMCAGWTGCPKRNAPGFPDNGQWKVKWEGLKPME
jgi:hypothetical protein